MILKFQSVRKQKIYNLLKGIETGDPQSVEVVNEDRYIQHNPQTAEGGEGLAKLFKRLSLTNPKVEIIRLFEDNDYVFGHTIYDFSSVRVGFEVFRYEGDQVVEHWDNIQPRVGHMVGGKTESHDLHLTEKNRNLVKIFIEDFFINKKPESYGEFVDVKSYCEHSTFCNLERKPDLAKYTQIHMVLAEGSFVLAQNQGFKDNKTPTSFYDLFRLKNGKIVEHWDTTEIIPPQSEWKNNNGKF